MRRVLIAGLRNAGAGYAQTRHNTGGAFLEALAKELGTRKWEKHASTACDTISLKLPPLPGPGPAEAILAQPRSFMNVCGPPIAKLATSLGVPAQQLVVVHDELELPVGKWQIRVGGSHKGHRGVASVCDALRTPDFTRVRIGVGRPPKTGDAARDGAAVAEYVLQRFPPADAAVLQERVFPAVMAALLACEAVAGPAAAAASAAAPATQAGAKPSPRQRHPQPPPGLPTAVAGGGGGAASVQVGAAPPVTPSSTGSSAGTANGGGGGAAGSRASAATGRVAPGT